MSRTFADGLRRGAAIARQREDYYATESGPSAAAHRAEGHMLADILEAEAATEGAEAPTPLAVPCANCGAIEGRACLNREPDGPHRARLHRFEHNPPSAPAPEVRAPSGTGVCGTCGGCGREEGEWSPTQEPCSDCNGTGRAPSPEPSLDGEVRRDWGPPEPTNLEQDAWMLKHGEPHPGFPRGRTGPLCPSCESWTMWRRADGFYCCFGCGTVPPLEAAAPPTPRDSAPRPVHPSADRGMCAMNGCDIPATVSETDQTTGHVADRLCELHAIEAEKARRYTYLRDSAPPAQPTDVREALKAADAEYAAAMGFCQTHRRDNCSVCAAQPRGETARERARARAHTILGLPEGHGCAGHPVRRSGLCEVVTNLVIAFDEKADRVEVLRRENEALRSDLMTAIKEGSKRGAERDTLARSLADERALLGRAMGLLAKANARPGDHDTWTRDVRALLSEVERRAAGKTT